MRLNFAMDGFNMKKPLICLVVTGREAGKAFKEIVRALIHDMITSISGAVVIPY